MSLFQLLSLKYARSWAMNMKSWVVLFKKKNKEEEEIAFVEGQGSMTCKNGSTGQTAHQVACIPRAAWDTPPQPLHAMLGREDVTGGTQGKVQVAKISYKLRDPEDGFPKLQMPAR